MLGVYRIGFGKTAMAEQSETTVSPVEPVESVVDKITEKIHDHDSSSSSSSDSEAEKRASPSSVKAKIYRLFGREKPVHQVFGGGKRKFSTCRNNLSFFFFFF